MGTSVAAIQMEVEVLQPEKNLKKAGEYIQECADAGASLVLLPELFNVGMVYHKKMWDYAESIPDGPTCRWMKSWSLQTGCTIAACIFEAAEGGGYRDTFVLSTEIGQIHSYSKRYPAFFERLFFGPGRTKGILDTPLGRVGVLVCWDMVHNKLVKELEGEIDILLITSAWPDLTTGNIPLPGFQRWMQRQVPGRPQQLAKRLGLPVVYTNTTGVFETKVPWTPLRYRSQYAGSACIIDGEGRITKSMNREQGFIVQQLDTFGVELRHAA